MSRSRNSFRAGVRGGGGADRQKNAFCLIESTTHSRMGSTPNLSMMTPRLEFGSYSKEIIYDTFI